MSVRTYHLRVVAISLLLSSTAVQIATAATAAEPLPAEDVAAVVNGAQISELIVERVAAQIQANNEGQQIDKGRVVDELVNLELLTQEAEKLDLENSQNVVSALRIQYLQTMANAYLGEISQQEQISDAELRAEYELQASRNNKEEFNASHILLDAENDAIAAIESLKNGDDFAELAKQLSTGPSGPSGGELGWFESANMVAEFSAAIATMDVGSVSAAPVQTQYGWHVIKLNDKRSAPKPDFETVKSGIYNSLMSDRLASKVEAIRAAASIEIK